MGVQISPCAQEWYLVRKDQWMRGLALGKPTHLAFVLRGNSENSARLRALFCFGGGGSESEAWNLLCPKIQKEFLR